MVADRIAAVLAALALLTGCGGGEPALTSTGAGPSVTPSVRSTSPAGNVVTDVDDGRTITVSVSAAVIVRLTTGTGASWSDLHATGPAEVVPVSYRTDPGYREWEIRLTGRGTVILESSCSGSGCERAQFRVSLQV